MRLLTSRRLGTCDGYDRIATVGDAPGGRHRVREISAPTALASTMSASRTIAPTRSIAFRRPARLRRATPTSIWRSRVVAHAGGDSSDVVQPWWHSLPVVHILVFSPETEDEAVYTTSRRDGDTAANSFVAFEDLRDATRASVAVSDQLDGCEMPTVDSVDPRVMIFLADSCGYGVEVVPAGGEFEPPATVIDDFRRSYEYEGGAEDERSRSRDGTDELAISTVDLQRYLSDGGALPVLPEEDDARAKEAAAEAEDGARTLEARRAAAEAVRGALTGSVSNLTGSVRLAAGVGGKVKSMLTPMRRVQSSMQGASTMYKALMGIAERRKGEEK